jgi:hypothetical protein
MADQMAKNDDKPLDNSAKLGTIPLAWEEPLLRFRKSS